ncbi:MAG TPA: isochorismatase family cysteine hydrolase [Thermoplasmataceae archaeon]|nr:isochorismatase family cysteine hydrolase [Thermoplasmataceae archaeon]
MASMDFKKKELHTALDPSRTALLIVDMQNDFVKDEGYLGQRKHGIDVVQETIPVIKRLLEHFRNNGLMVVYTETVHMRYTNSLNWVSRSAEKSLDPMICKSGTWGAETIPELKPLENEPVIQKHRYDAFMDTDLHVVLRSNNISNLVIVGTQTNLCVESTARHAYMMDYMTIMVSDGVSTPETEYQAPLLKNFSENFGYVMSAEEVLQELKKQN